MNYRLTDLQTFDLQTFDLQTFDLQTYRLSTKCNHSSPHVSYCLWTFYNL